MGGSYSTDAATEKKKESKRESQKKIKQESKQEQYDLSVHLLDADGVVFNDQYFFTKVTTYESTASQEEKTRAKARGQAAAGGEGFYYFEVCNFYKEKIAPEKWNKVEEETIPVVNGRLINFMAQDSKNTKQGIQIESFSMRQGPGDDKHGRDKYGSSLFSEALSILHKALRDKTTNRCKLGKYLISDTCLGLEGGTCFDEMSEKYDEYAFHDVTKISMLYAKMQRIAFENQGKKIHVTVWDDDRDLLTWLHAFFSDASRLHLIPKGITLSFMHHPKVSDIPADVSKMVVGSDLKGMGQNNSKYEDSLMHYYKSSSYTIIRKSQKSGLKEKPAKEIYSCFDELVRAHKIGMVAQARERFEQECVERKNESVSRRFSMPFLFQQKKSADKKQKPEQPKRRMTV